MPIFFEYFLIDGPDGKEYHVNCTMEDSTSTWRVVLKCHGETLRECTMPGDDYSDFCIAIAQADDPLEAVNKMM